MADVAIPLLPALPSVNPSDILVVDNGSVTGAARADQLPISVAAQAALDSKAAGSHGHNFGDISGLTAALALLAALDSPTFTGTPSAPTPAQGNNSTRIATTAFVQAALAALVNASPATLDTLNELAAALGNDPNFAATMATALANKQPLNAVLTTLAGSSVDGQALVTAANFAAMRTLLSLNNLVNVEQAPRLITRQADKTAAYTLVDTDARTLIPYNGSGNVNFTLNTGRVAGFSAVLMQRGAGTITLAGSATLRGTLSTVNPYDMMTITQIGTNEYLCKVG